MDLVFFRRVPIDFNGEKKFFSAIFFMLLLVEGEEKECLPKFGVLIFILAHEIKQFYSLSWKHCRCLGLPPAKIDINTGTYTPESTEQ